MMTERSQSIRERFEAADQGHVFRFFDELDEQGREMLLAQLESVDLELVRELGGMFSDSASDAAAPTLEPPGTFPLERSPEQLNEAIAAWEEGERILSAGKVGYCLVAGGQASRLGYDGPKGLFPVGPVSERVLFDFHARRLMAARRRHEAPIHWYIMTSPANDRTTREAFEAANFYGVEAANVHFFQQEMLPALSTDGKILMSEKDSLFLAPNGHGGSLLALEQSGVLANAKANGIEYISYFQVDNPLARPADPLFVGLHALRGAEMSTKVVAKRDAAEKVGVIGKIDGQFGCIEYSDLSAELREARDDTGKLRFNDGNIAVHMINVEFIDRLTSGGLKLPWHLARKKMQVLGDDGEPDEREGGKFETFVFDALAQSRNSVTLEVDRALEFSPVKNAEGEDSPRTTRRDLCRLFTSWVDAAGLARPDSDAEGVHPIEIDPLFAEHIDEFVEKEPAQASPSENGGHLYR